MDKALENNSSLHLMGLMSPGGVHSHITHLYGILELAKKKGLEKGLEKGMEKGMEKGKEEVAREMLKEQFPAETIARLTGLTEEQVRAL